MRYYSDRTLRTINDRNLNTKSSLQTPLLPRTLKSRVHRKGGRTEESCLIVDGQTDEGDTGRRENCRFPSVEGESLVIIRDGDWFFSSRPDLRTGTGPETLRLYGRSE